MNWVLAIVSQFWCNYCVNTTAGSFLCLSKGCLWSAEQISQKQICLHGFYVNYKKKQKKNTTHIQELSTTNQTYVKFAGKENKHAGVEGQAWKAAIFYQMGLFKLPAWSELLMFLSGSRRILSPCEEMTVETHCPKSSVCLFQINLAYPPASLYINMKWCFFFVFFKSELKD